MVYSNDFRVVFLECIQYFALGGIPKIIFIRGLNFANYDFLIIDDINGWYGAYMHVFIVPFDFNTVIPKTMKKTIQCCRTLFVIGILIKTIIQFWVFGSIIFSIGFMFQRKFLFPLSSHF